MFDCPQCIQTFVSYQDMKKHTENAHSYSTPTPYVPSECIVCSKVYLNPEALKFHLKAMHNLTIF